MENDVGLKKYRAFKSKPKLFYEMSFYFVSIGLGSVHTQGGLSYFGAPSRVSEAKTVNKRFRKRCRPKNERGKASVSKRSLATFDGDRRAQLSKKARFEERGCTLRDCDSPRATLVSQSRL